ncbi:hypothetical protein [Streptomyces xiamenensis]|uniref:hypothetical protein n=1 Tax=Streptomyces xiamenensis TaxID=408015 RepID=UPI0037D44491
MEASKVIMTTKGSSAEMSVKYKETARGGLAVNIMAGQLVTTGRRRILRLGRHWPWSGVITDALEQLALVPNPADQQLAHPCGSSPEPEQWNPTRRLPGTTLGSSTCPLSPRHENGPSTPSVDGLSRKLRD